MFNSGVLNLIFFSFLTGFGSLFVKFIHGLNPQEILFYRALLASIFLIVVAVYYRKQKELVFRFPFATFTMAITQGLSIYFYYLALERTTIANAVLLVYTAPLFSVILSSIFLHEKIEKRTIYAIIFSLLGVLIVSNPSQINLSPTQFYGSLFALIGGFFYAAMAISSKSLTHKTTPLYSAFWQYFIIAICSFFFIFPLNLSKVLPNVPFLLYLGWAAGGFAFLLYMHGIKKVKGQIIQIITVLEIVISSLSGVIFLHEKLELLTVFGGIFILLSVFIVSTAKK